MGKYGLLQWASGKGLPCIAACGMLVACGSSSPVRSAVDAKATNRSPDGSGITFSESDAHAGDAADGMPADDGSPDGAPVPEADLRIADTDDAMPPDRGPADGAPVPVADTSVADTDDAAPPADGSNGDADEGDDADLPDMRPDASDPLYTTWDVDADGASSATTDAVLVARYLFGFRGPALVDGVVGAGAARSTAPAIESYLETLSTMGALDVDATGTSEALTDGMLLTRFLDGVTGAPLVDGLMGPGARRTDPQRVAEYLACIDSAKIWSADVEVGLVGTFPRCDYLDPTYATLDVDASGTKDADTDGMLLVRYLFGSRGDALVADVVGDGATRSSADAIEAYLAELIGTGVLDVDHNGTTDALSDGLLVVRYLTGLSGTELVDGAVAADAGRTDAATIAGYLTCIDTAEASDFSACLE
jgi:hypothetical protein